jgi:hypothetical protein
MQNEKKTQNMKKFFIMLAFWFVTIISVVVGSKLYIEHQGKELSVTAVPYIKQVIPEVSKWDPAITRGLMAAEVLETIPDDRFVRAMTWFSKLGDLKSMEEPVFKKLHSEEETEIGVQTIIEYDINAKYENGDALISLKLLDRGGVYDIYRFNLSSSLLAE